MARICLAVTVIVAVGVSTRWWDTSGARLPVVQAAFPVIGLAAVAWAVLLVVLLRRKIVFALPALAVALVPVALAASAMGASTVAPTDNDEVIAASNLEFGRADPEEIVEHIRALGVDTLVLTELTPDAADAIDAAGASELLPHRVGSPQLGADGTVILSRHSLSEVSAEHVPGLFDQPVAIVQAPTGDYVVRAMHPYPPTPNLVRGWHRQLGEAADWVAEQPAQTPLVLAGDFNASQAHPAYRRLAEGLVDAQRAAGSGWVRTWPQGSSIPAFVQLDHVLVRQGEVVDAGSSTVAGTDHALVWARLALDG
ncbi:endonuclease/exonuclease/phosphatase family protein [Knoellia sp. CPCC 206453]|uniref:endonuclease/exonuclease/phosphatase family protein n=1 Tax=Knoellia pratensis TaxID=3404796 RepID=UPI003608D13C